jgi:hypothetical protein
MEIGIDSFASAMISNETDKVSLDAIPQLLDDPCSCCSKNKKY